MRLAEFNEKQTALLEQMAKEYVTAMRTDALLFVEFLHSDRSLYLSLVAAKEHDPRTVAGLSACDLREAINKLWRKTMLEAYNAKV